ncbi:Os06g0171450 [Oryza sativa Japonica Group]|uniref:Os06g0171450 protein n=1 Tax=Oryza sativa subsp. japonica TaxID=39947 RepID=A0A0P0WTH6_ORYSJ|nr:Os06g0171450 [Oryza sativa Japonica Group]
MSILPVDLSAPKPTLWFPCASGVPGGTTASFLVAGLQTNIREEERLFSMENTSTSPLHCRGSSQSAPSSQSAAAACEVGDHHALTCASSAAAPCPG